jgi:hypothetical protein
MITAPERGTLATPLTSGRKTVRNVGDRVSSSARYSTAATYAVEYLIEQKRSVRR